MSKFCNICLESDVRLFRITGAEIQQTYETIRAKKIEADGSLHFACFICYRYLKNCHLLTVKSQNADKLLNQSQTGSCKLTKDSVVLLDRRKYGLINSLSFSKTETTDIPGNTEITVSQNQNKIIHHTENQEEKLVQTKNPDIINIKEVIVINESDDESEPPNKKPNLENETIFEDEDEDHSIELVMDENISVSPNPENSSSFSPELIPSYSTCHKNTSTTKQLTFQDGGNSFLNGINTEISTALPKANMEQEPVIDSPSSTSETRYNPDKITYKSKNCTCSSTICEMLDKGIQTETKYFTSVCNDRKGPRVDLKNKNKEISNQNKLLQCQFCEYESSVNKHFVEHMKSHADEKIYMCDICNMKFREKKLFTNHLRVHMLKKCR